MNRLILLSAYILITITNLQCSDDETKNIQVNLSPSSPVVFLSTIPITVNGEEVTIPAPWIQFYMNIENRTGEPLYVLAVNFEVSALVGGVDTVVNDTAIGPGDVFDSNGDPRTTTIVDMSADGDYTFSNPIFISGLPDAEEGASDSFVFTVRGTIEAYTGEKVYIITRPEFGNKEGHILIINKALYRLKSSGVRWHERLLNIL